MCESEKIYMCKVVLQDVCMCVSSSLIPGSQEKQPGNLREFKLLLSLPESWQNQSNFRTLSVPIKFQNVVT